MRYFGGCDAGSTYTKCVILDENGKIAAAVTRKSRINPVLSAQDAMGDAISEVQELNSAEDLTYLVGTGYGRNKVPFADENISEISCHAMGVHSVDPKVKAIVDIGGQDVKGIAVDSDGTVLNFAMNDKCAAGTGRFFETMAGAFEMSLDDFSKLSLKAKNVIPITAQCTVFAESEVVSLVGEGKPMDEIAAGIQLSVAKRCFAMGSKDSIKTYSNADKCFRALKDGKVDAVVCPQPSATWMLNQDRTSEYTTTSFGSEALQLAAAMNGGVDNNILRSIINKTIAVDGAYFNQLVASDSLNASYGLKGVFNRLSVSAIVAMSLVLVMLLIIAVAALVIIIRRRKKERQIEKQQAELEAAIEVNKARHALLTFVFLSCLGVFWILVLPDQLRAIVIQLVLT